MIEGVLPDRGPGRRPASPPARRSHLERLVQHYGDLTGIAPDRVRRWISTMVFLGALDRVSVQETPRFLLKGGVAMELRLGATARATRDIDVTFLGSPDALDDNLTQALRKPYSGFSFLPQGIERVAGTPHRRVAIKLFYRDRSWATLRVEVAPPESAVIDAEEVPAISIEDFGLQGPKTVRCLSTRFQTAQKIHAVTERFAHRENDRFRDLIDLVLLRGLVSDLQAVRNACIEIFTVRAKHAWPAEVAVPASWREPYRELARRMDFPIVDVDEAAGQLREFVAEIDVAANDSGTDQ